VTLVTPFATQIIAALPRAIAVRVVCAVMPEHTVTQSMASWVVAITVKSAPKPQTRVLRVVTVPAPTETTAALLAVLALRMLTTCLLARLRVEEEAGEEAEEEAVSAVAQAAAPPCLAPQASVSQARLTSYLRPRSPRLLPASVAVTVAVTVEVAEEALMDSRAPVFVPGVACTPWLFSLFLDLLLLSSFERAVCQISYPFLSRFIRVAFL